MKDVTVGCGQAGGGLLQGTTPRRGRRYFLGCFALAGLLTAVAVNLTTPKLVTHQTSHGNESATSAMAGKPTLQGQPAARFCVLLLDEACRKLKRWTSATERSRYGDLLKLPRRSLGDAATVVQMSQHVPLRGRLCYYFTFQRSANGDRPADEELLVYIDEESGLPLACQLRTSRTPGVNCQMRDWSAWNDAPWYPNGLARSRAKPDATLGLK